MLALIRAALQAAGPVVRAAASKALTVVTKTPVPTSATGIISAIRAWAQGNPVKTMVAVNALAATGVELALSDVKEYANQHADTPGVLGLVDEFALKLASQRANFTGDGKPGTIHGLNPDDYIAILNHKSEVDETIRRAVRAVGSFEALKALRKAIFLEDGDYTLFSG